MRLPPLQVGDRHVEGPQRRVVLADELPQGRKAGAVELEQYFLRLLKKRGNKPGTDLMGLFIAGQNEGKLTPEEVCHQCVVILNAGHVTTIDQLANAVSKTAEIAVRASGIEVLCRPAGKCLRPMARCNQKSRPTSRLGAECVMLPAEM